MGLRSAFMKWLGVADDTQPSEQRPARSAGGADAWTEVTSRVEPINWGTPGMAPYEPPSQNYIAAATSTLSAPLETGPPPQPLQRPEPVGGGLVVGQADHRLPAQQLPAFYVPQTPPAQESPSALISPPLATHAEYDHEKVREVWDMLSSRADQLVTNFYAELFYRLPEAMSMFPSSMAQQRNDFGRALVQWVVTDDPDSLTSHLDQLGADHRKFDVEPQHYEVAGVALVSAMKTLAGTRWTAAHEAAIVGSYTRLASVMIDGAIRRASEPASWGAAVVEHQRVFQDFAVLRIQPDAPYPYKPGQYLTLELPSHRKLWRQMSIASAPRADNTFDIHVRSVGASGVSAALVAHTRAGARLRLGPPRGNDLVVEPGTVPGGLLCVASGTGAAPITAVVESTLGWKDPPSQLYAYVGGRTRNDIYPVDQLNRLVRAGGKWNKVHVQGVVSDDPTFIGLRGKVETVVPNLEDWARLGVDVLVSGPSPMIAATVTSLAGKGVPLSKIHFDQYDAST